MKKLIFCIISMMLFIFYSCSDNNLIKPGQKADQKGLATDDASARKRGGHVFTVHPNGTDDTENLLQAFADAQAAGPGSVVQLTEGEFNIGFIEIRDFNGCFRGAGKAITKIQNVDNLPSCDPIYANNMFETLINFVGGEVNISKMTFAAKDGNICPTDPFGVLYVLMELSDYTAMYMPPKRFVKAVVEDVDFIGGYVNEENAFGTHYNVNMPIFVGSNYSYPIANYPLGSVDVTIKNCTFDNLGVGPDIWGLDENSTVNIENNIVTNTAYPIFLGSCLGTKLTVKNNLLRNSSSLIDLYIDDADWGLYPNAICQKRTEYTILGNNFLSPPGTISIYMCDSRRTVHPDEGFPQLIEVKGNIFNTKDGGTAILGLNNVDAKIWNNKFSGTGTTGVMLDGDLATNTFAENLKLMGNNFLNANYTDANVYLGANTMNCKVVGVATDKVIDLGVNNTIIGVKAQKHGPKFHKGMKGNFPNMRESMMKMSKR